MRPDASIIRAKSKGEIQFKALTAKPCYAGFDNTVSLEHKHIKLSYSAPTPFASIHAASAFCLNLVAYFRFAMDNFKSWTAESDYADRISPQQWNKLKVELQRMQAEGKEVQNMVAVLREKYGLMAK